MNTGATSRHFDFTGPVAANYDHYLGPLFFEPYAIVVANRIRGLRVQLALEIASGTGRVTRHLRKVLPATSKLIASDISPDMLAVAKEKLKTEDIEWQIIDAQELPFESNSIDLIICCFGYMFVPDKPKAFSEAYRVLKPEGMFLFTTWDKLDASASSVYRSIVEKYLGEPLPECYNLPTSMNEESALKKMLRQAGFSKIEIEKVHKSSIINTAREAAEGLIKGGSFSDEIMKRNPLWIDEIATLLEKELAQKFGEAPMVAPLSAVISQAWK